MSLAHTALCITSSMYRAGRQHDRLSRTSHSPVLHQLIHTAMQGPSVSAVRAPAGAIAYGALWAKKAPVGALCSVQALAVARQPSAVARETNNYEQAAAQDDGQLLLYYEDGARSSRLLLGRGGRGGRSRRLQGSQAGIHLVGVQQAVLVQIYQVAREDAAQRLAAPYHQPVVVREGLAGLWHLRMQAPPCCATRFVNASSTCMPDTT